MGLTKASTRSALFLWVGLGGFVVYYGIHAFRFPWVGDMAVYGAVVHALYLDPWLPPHSTMAVEPGYSVWYSPYIVLIAMAGKVLHVTPYRALQIAGVANLVLYAGAIALFFRTFASRPRSPWPPLVFLAVSLFLRSLSYSWSSETSHQTMRVIQAYPSMLAWALALVAFVLAERLARGTSQRATLVALVILIAFLLLTHPITATWVIGIVGLRGLYGVLRGEGVTTAGKVVMAIAAAVGLSLLWPYYSLFLLRSVISAHEGSPFGARPIHVMPAVYGFALLASIPAIKAGKHLFWMAAFVATTGAWAAFRFAGIEHLDRYVFFMAFFAQVLTADAADLAIKNVWRPDTGHPQPRVARIAAGAYLVTLCLAILWAPSMRGQWREFIKGPAMLWNRPSTEQAYYDRWTPFRAALKPGDVIMVPVVHAAIHIAAVTGARAVAVPFAEAVPDYFDRTASIGRFFLMGASPETRLSEIKRWRANKIVLIESAIDLAPEIEAVFGEPRWRSATAIVYDASR